SRTVASCSTASRPRAEAWAPGSAATSNPSDAGFAGNTSRRSAHRGRGRPVALAERVADPAGPDPGRLAGLERRLGVPAPVGAEGRRHGSPAGAQQLDRGRRHLAGVGPRPERAREAVALAAYHRALLAG